MGAGRDVWVKIRASEAERAEWHAKARSAGLTLSDLVRLRGADQPSDTSYVLHLILGCLVPHLEGNHRPGVSMQMSLGSPLTVLVVRVHARTGQFCCTHDLGGGHVVFDCVPQFPRDFGPIGTRNVGPHVR